MLDKYLLFYAVYLIHLLYCRAQEYFSIQALLQVGLKCSKLLNLDFLILNEYIHAFTLLLEKHSPIIYVQVLIYLACHPSCEVRKVAYDATKKVLSSSSGLAEDTLFLFTAWLSLVGERL